MTDMFKIDELSDKEIQQFVSPMKLDLIAVFRIIKDDILQLLQTAKKEQWPIEYFIQKVNNLFEEQDNGRIRLQ